MKTIKQMIQQHQDKKAMIASIKSAGISNKALKPYKKMSYTQLQKAYTKFYYQMTNS